MKKLHNYGTFNNDLYKVDIRDENNLNKKLIEWCSKTEQEINCEIKETEYKLDCEKKHIKYHPIQHV